MGVMQSSLCHLMGLWVLLGNGAEKVLLELALTPSDTCTPHTACPLLIVTHLVTRMGDPRITVSPKKLIKSTLESGNIAAHRSVSRVLPPMC